MFNIKFKLYPESTIVDQAATKEETSDGAHGESPNEKKVAGGKSKGGRGILCYIVPVYGWLSKIWRD